MAYKKTSLEEMAEEIADQLVIYLKGGELGRKLEEGSGSDDRRDNLNLGSFFNKLDLNITSLKELLRIHFVLRSEVVDFVKKLPWRIRGIKTSTTKNKRIFRNEVRGRIDWQRTIKERCKQNFRDRTIFACDESDKDYNIKENLVLKKLLSIIYGVIDNELMGKPDNYSWLADWLGEEKLANNLRELLYRNIYLKRINIDEITITDRMIQDTKRSRNMLYKEAAELLDFYREEIEREKWWEDSQKIKKMLQTTFINPEKDSVLFELYWAIKILKCNTEIYQLEIIDKNSDAVAHWNSGKTNYSLYHNCTGSKRLSWEVGMNEVKPPVNEYLKRIINSRETYWELSKSVFYSKNKKKKYMGRKARYCYRGSK